MPNHQATCTRNTVGGIPEDSPVPFTFLRVLDSRRTDTFVFIPLDTGSSGTTPSWWRLRSLRQQVCTAVTYMHPPGFYATIGKPVSYSVKTPSSTTEHDPLTACTEDLWGLFKLAVLAGDGSNPANMEHGLPFRLLPKKSEFSGDPRGDRSAFMLSPFPSSPPTQYSILDVRTTKSNTGCNVGTRVLLGQ